MICQFIDSLRPRFRVEPICTALASLGVQVAPRTYRNWKQASPATRTVDDAVIVNALLATVGTPEGMYGRRKMTHWLRRQGFEVAHCTVDRLMRQQGLSGVVRGRSHRTTVPGKDGCRAGDLVNRDFTAAAPNCLWVADFTYVRTWAGFVYVAFIIDVFSRRIVGWHAATTKTTDLVTTALRMAVWQRGHDGQCIDVGLIHHSDAGSQYTAEAFAETLRLSDMRASIGSVGDAYDNALAETTIGLFKTEAVGKRSPFINGPLQTISDVEWAVLGWVDWFNQRRLHSELDYQTPVDFEAQHYTATVPHQPVPAHA